MMKKRNNKVIILILIGIIFAVSLGIFILNYSKDDSSFSILEKKWINDNASNVMDVSIYNDIPVFGKNGKGLSFDLLDSFTSKYDINFNKISYYGDSSTNLKDISFKVIGNDIDLTNNDILLYEDHYVIVGNDSTYFNNLSDINDIDIMVLSNDVNTISNYMSDASDVGFVPKKDIDEIKTSFDSDKSVYAVLPYNMYVDFILQNDLNILFHLGDVSKKYVLNVKDKTLLNIMKKFYVGYKKDEQDISYKNNFLSEYFIDKKINESDKMSYNSSSYNVGYVTLMPFTSKEDNDFVGNLSNYLSGFEDLFDVSFKLVYFDSIDSLKTALSHGEIDIAFANFNTKGMNIDVINTAPLFKEEYSVLSKDEFVVNSMKSLKNKEISVVKNSFINDLALTSGIKNKDYDNTDALIRNIHSSDVIVIDKATYDYYRETKFKDFKELYVGSIPFQYNFVIRDVNKNTVMGNMFKDYVSSIDYNTIKYKYNTNDSVYDFNLLVIFISCILGLIIIIISIYFIMKKKKNELSLKNGDKLKYVDAMTSLKNRTYLNLKIKEWDDNVIYPQAFVVVDLNNIKDINDNHGHEEGDIIIKKAASILIVNQEANTDIIRTDGNEFLVYMVGYSEKDVILYTRKIYKELKELPYGYGAAVGYSMIMDDVKTVDDAINEATIEMRKNKQ